jgi:hypothetical protein
MPSGKGIFLYIFLLIIYYTKKIAKWILVFAKYTQEQTSRRGAGGGNRGQTPILTFWMLK